MDAETKQGQKAPLARPSTITVRRCCADLPLRNSKGKALGEGAVLGDFTLDEFYSVPSRCSGPAEWIVAIRGDRSGYMPTCLKHATTAAWNYLPSIAPSVSVLPASPDDFAAAEPAYRRMRAQRITFLAMARARPLLRVDRKGNAP